MGLISLNEKLNKLVVNFVQAQQKKDREAREKQERLQWEREEVNTMIERGKPKVYKPVF